MKTQESTSKIRYCLLLALVAWGMIPGANNVVAAKHPAIQDPIRSTQPVAQTDPSQQCEGMDQLAKIMRQVSTQVETLAKRVSDLEKERLFDVTRVLLVGEEQRAETLQGRLRETTERQLLLQAKMDQLDNQLRPESIERLFVGVGSVRPEEARDVVRRRLSLEKQGIQTQLELVRQERNRFQAALASADMTIQRLRMRLAEAGRP